MILAKIKYGFTFKDMVLDDRYTTEGWQTLSTTLSALHIYNTFPTGTMIEELYQKLFNKYGDEIIFLVNEEDREDASVILEKWRTLLCNFLNIYYETREYYEVVIGLQEANKGKLLDMVEAENVNEAFFNDTPQNAGGVFDGTDYTTNYTKTKNVSKSPMNTISARLKEVNDNLRMFWRDWLNDFHKLFIEEEANYE